jgi:hypothetical protein
MNEKDEKFDEKAMEKQEEKSYQEKNWDEKWRRDPLAAVVWALVFIWAGLVFLVANLGYLDFILVRTSDMPGLRGFDAWSIVLVGAGVIFLFEALIRILVPEFRRAVTGTIIFAIILIGIGLGDLISWNIIWPTILIVLGLSIILRGFMRGEGGGQ